MGVPFTEAMLLSPAISHPGSADNYAAGDGELSNHLYRQDKVTLPKGSGLGYQQAEVAAPDSLYRGMVLVADVGMGCRCQHTVAGVHRSLEWFLADIPNLGFRVECVDEIINDLHPHAPN
jgi:hypothetical protein